MIVARAKFRVSITRSELIEQEFGIVSLPIGQSAHFVREREHRRKLRSILAHHLCTFGQHKLCDNVGWFNQKSKVSTVTEKNKIKKL